MEIVGRIRCGPGVGSASKHAAISGVMTVYVLLCYCLVSINHTGSHGREQMTSGGARESGGTPELRRPAGA